MRPPSKPRDKMRPESASIGRILLLDLNARRGLLSMLLFVTVVIE